jgi:hypothetical protein
MLKMCPSQPKSVTILSRAYRAMDTDLSEPIHAPVVADPYDVALPQALLGSQSTVPVLAWSVSNDDRWSSLNDMNGDVVVSRERLDLYHQGFC